MVSRSHVFTVPWRKVIISKTKSEPQGGLTPLGGRGLCSVTRPRLPRPLGRAGVDEPPGAGAPGFPLAPGTASAPRLCELGVDFKARVPGGAPLEHGLGCWGRPRGVTHTEAPGAPAGPSQAESLRVPSAPLFVAPLPGTALHSSAVSSQCAEPAGAEQRLMFSTEITFSGLMAGSWTLFSFNKCFLVD